MRRTGMLVLLIVALGLQSGCVGVQTRATREYVLRWRGEASEDFQREEPQLPRGRSVAIGPIIIPTYLQRTGIVTRVDENRINASVSHTWGEPLEAGVARLLAEKVAKDTGWNRIARQPWPFPGFPDLRVAVEIINFEYEQAEEKIFLVARWTVLEGQRSSAKLLRSHIFEQAIEDDDFSTIVNGMSEMVLDLGAEIALDIEELQRLEGAATEEGAAPDA